MWIIFFLTHVFTRLKYNFYCFFIMENVLKCLKAIVLGYLLPYLYVSPPIWLNSVEEGTRSFYKPFYIWSCRTYLLMCIRSAMIVCGKDGGRERSHRKWGIWRRWQKASVKVGFCSHEWLATYWDSCSMMGR